MPMARERTRAPARRASWREKGRAGEEEGLLKLPPPNSSSTSTLLFLLWPPPPRMRAKRCSANVCELVFLFCFWLIFSDLFRE